MFSKDRMSAVILEREQLYPIKPFNYSVSVLDLLSKHWLHTKYQCQYNPGHSGWPVVIIHQQYFFCLQKCTDNSPVWELVLWRRKWAQTKEMLRRDTPS